MGRPRIDFPINLGGPLSFANSITIKGNLILDGNVQLNGTPTNFAGPSYVTFNQTLGTLFNTEVDIGAGIRFLNFGVPNQVLLGNNARGLWTPTLKGSGGAAGAYAQTAAGIYYLIGNLCVVQGGITLTNKGSWTGITSISGLPEVADPLGLNQSVPVLWMANCALAGRPGGHILAGNSAIQLVTANDTTGIVNTIDYVTYITNTADIEFSAAYLMASTID
jgi:hypothetical protein